jgi:hypothetical protein
MPGTSFDLIQSAVGRPAHRSRLPPRSDGRRASQGRHKALSLSLASPPQGRLLAARKGQRPRRRRSLSTPPDQGSCSCN